MHKEGYKTKDVNRIELLRTILEKELDRSVSYDEAKDIGVGLVSFYKLLSDEDSFNGS